eukprot:TRINITY_DN11778_c0_g1_i2.p1 TRINITY_DN11778_c0_g1~~TRINITY_DN11778_c0_g1_i2.p1  ORF type:complete len:339 (+),score=46.46 TRINITY_DN11778_c0_g1_i2:41-1057(+)
MHATRAGQQLDAPRCGLRPRALLRAVLLALAALASWLVYLAARLAGRGAPPLQRGCAASVAMQRGAARPRVVLATRFWGSSEQDFATLAALVSHMAGTGTVDAMLVAVRAERDRTGAADRLEELVSAAESASQGGHPHLRVLPVAPWGGVSHSLNLLLQTARSECSADLLMYMSTETRAPRGAVHAMIRAADADTIVAGLALPGHSVPPSTPSAELSALTCPWNTCAVWPIQHLGLTGFALVSDDVEPPGMEECAAAALLQRLRPGLRIKLLHAGGGPAADWRTEWDSPSRSEAHQKKMVSKQERAEVQLRRLGITGTVDFIDTAAAPPQGAGVSSPP